jgi:hypothetical protein
MGALCRGALGLVKPLRKLHVREFLLGIHTPPNRGENGCDHSDVFVRVQTCKFRPLLCAEDLKWIGGALTRAGLAERPGTRIRHSVRKLSVDLNYPQNLGRF